MSSLPGTPKQKKGIRRLLKDSLTRSRSRSPSQSQLQLDPGASSTTTRPDEGASQITSPGRDASRIDSATAITHPPHASSTGSVGLVGGPLSIPVIIQPVDVGPRTTQAAIAQDGSLQIVPVASGTPSNVAAYDLPELSNEASRIPTLTESLYTKPSPVPSIRPPERTPSSCGTGNPELVALPTIPPKHGQKRRNVAWDGLRRSLRLLSDSSSVFPHLSSAIEPLLACLEGLELATQNRPDFEELANELSILSESLKQHIDEPSSILLSSSTISVALAIERQGMMIREGIERMRGGIREESTGEEELVRHYRRIQSYFRQLQMNAIMSTWSIANEHLVNTRLEGLNPAKQATHDSSLSTEISRRVCTDDTRIGVLDGLDSWLQDSTSSSIYWMNGIAGTGKTTIASTFCERVEQRKLLAASFFCTRTSVECRSMARIVPTIAYQLARYSIPFQSTLCKILGQNPDIGSKNVLKQFEQLLKEPLQQVKDSIPDNLVVVIDALDECDDRNGVELVLDMLFRHASDVPLKFLITSRPEPEIYSKMSTHAQSREVIHLHDIEKSLVQADIELYLKEELEFMSPPANQAEFEQLVQRSGALFIYAATLVRYIRSGKRLADPHKRLRSVLGMIPESTKKHMHIDALYTAVLKSALSEDELEPDEIEDVRLVLRTVLFAQEPIGVEIIAELAEIADPQCVLHALHPLRSVLHQSEGTGLVSTLHASFPDFMFSNERSGTYFYDIVEHSQALAHRCFLVMKEQLRFIICNLASLLVPDKEVGNLQEKIKANISPTLSYTCRYWASHLALSLRCDLMLTLLGEFLGSRLLFWIEVLSLLREMPVGIDELLKAQQWLINHVEHASSRTTLFVDDARNFLTGYAINPTSQSTPHPYISSLPFCSHTSLVYQKYRRRSRGLLVLKGSLMKIREAAPLAIWNVGLSINSLALSPDGSQVVIGCSDATLSILSAYNGAFHVGPFQAHVRSIGSVAFSPDGGRVVSRSSGDVQVWNARNGTAISGPFQGHIGSVNSVSFSPDGTRVISGGRDSGIRIWNAYDGTPLLHMNHVDLVRCVVFSPKGALIASSSSDHTIQLWNAYDGTFARPRFQGHMGQVQCLAFTPDGTRLVSGFTDHTVRVWNISDGSLFNNPFEGHTFFVDSVAVSPDGTRVASAGGGDIRVWNIENGALVAGPFFGQKVSSKSLAYSPDGTRIISGSQDNTICLRSVRDGIFPPAPLPTQYALTRINTVAFCADNAHFMSSTGSGILNIWDTSDGSFITSPNEIKIIPSPLSTLSYDGSFLAATSKSGSLQVVDTVDGSLVAGPFDIERDFLSTFQFSRNNDAAIVGCYDGTIKLCELQSGNTAFGSLKGHHKRVSVVAESPDCSLLVSFSDYEMAFRLWNIVAPALDLQLSSPSIDSGSGRRYAAIYEGWNIREDGWVVNNRQDLLFWLPSDIASAWCSPYATLVITESGRLQVPKQKLFIGDQWTSCYVPD